MQTPGLPWGVLHPQFITGLFSLLVRHSVFLACPDAVSRGSVPVLSPVEGFDIPSALIVCKPEITTATFWGPAMTKVALLHLVNEY